MKFNGSVEVNPRIKTAAQALQLNGADMRRMAHGVDMKFREQERKLFATEGASGGKRWAPLSRAYKKQKDRKYGKRKIMSRKGTLRKGLTQRSHPDHILLWGTKPSPFVVFGTQNRVGAYHIKPKGDVSNPFYNRNLPDRDVMQRTNAQEKQLLGVVEQHMLDKLRRFAKSLATWSKRRGR